MSLPTDPFERMLELNRSEISQVQWGVAVRDVRDTMHYAALACESQFGKGNFTPDHVLKVLELMVLEHIEVGKAADRREMRKKGDEG